MVFVFDEEGVEDEFGDDEFGGDDLNPVTDDTEEEEEADFE